MLTLLLSVVLLAAGMCALWRSSGRMRGDAGGAGNRSEYLAGDCFGPESLEGILVNQLVDGLITGRQYARAMEHLAARDDERHPLAVPRETGSAGV